MKQKILLVTTVDWPSAARLAGAFVTLGAEVEAVFPRRHVLRRSRYLKHGYRYRPLRALESIAAAIRSSEPDRIIPCDDRALSLLLQLGEFSALLERSLGPLANYSVLTARVASLEAAQAEGICVPPTVAVPGFESLHDALHEVGLPCVMKADGSWGGDGVKFICSLRDAERAYRMLKGPPSAARSLARAVLRKDLHFIEQARHPGTAAVSLQALIPGKPATSVFAARDGEVLAELHMDVVRWAGEAGPASLMQRVDDPAMQEAAKKIAARFKLNGLIGLDFMRDKEGVPHLIEINPRATQICHLALGPDLAAALLDKPARPAVTDRRTVALFPQLLTAGEADRPLYQDIPWDDPAVLRAVSGDFLPEAGVLEDIPEFARPRGGAPILRPYGSRTR